MKFSALGDLAATLPFLRTMSPCPCIITSPMGKAFLKDEFDDFIVLPKKSIATHLQLVQAVRQRGFSDLIDLQGNDRCRSLSRAISFFSKTRIHNGYDPRSKYSEFSPYAAEIFERARASQKFVPKPREYIILNTGSSAKWAAKRPPLWKWQEFAALLDARYQLPFKLTGSQEEYAYIQGIAESLPYQTEVLAGKTSLAELKPLCRGAFLTVSTDSAAMHISAAEQTPTIGIFGSTTLNNVPGPPWAVGLYDREYYPDGQLPKCTDKVDGYYDHINLEEGLIALQAYLPS
jgi:ADP-heptose:LPS heptosyltransferase